MVAAKTREALQFLCAAFEQRRVQKRYMCEPESSGVPVLSKIK